MMHHNFPNKSCINFHYQHPKIKKCAAEATHCKNAQLRMLRHNSCPFKRMRKKRVHFYQDKNTHSYKWEKYGIVSQPHHNGK